MSRNRRLKALLAKKEKNFEKFRRAQGVVLLTTLSIFIGILGLILYLIFV